MACLNVSRIISDPSSRAISYGLARKAAGQLTGERVALVSDLYGATFDVSLIYIDDISVFKVMATEYARHFGGQDCYNRMVDQFMNELWNNQKKDIFWK